MSFINSKLFMIIGCFGGFCMGAQVFLKVGFILDEELIPQNDQLYTSLNILKQKYSSSAIDFRVAFIKGNEPMQALKELCALTGWGAATAVSLTSCSTTRLLESVAYQWKLPLIIMAGTSKCGENLRPQTLDQFSSMTLRTNFERAVYVVERIMIQSSLTSFVIFYDESFDFNYVEYLRSDLHETARKLKLTVDHKLIKITSRHSTELSTQLAKIQGEAHFFKFIILAGENSGKELLKQATKIGLTGRQFLWMLANAESDILSLGDLSDKLNLIAISRSYGESTYAEDKGALYYMTVSPAMKTWRFLPLVNAAELALVAMNKSVRYVNFTQAKDLRCSEIQSRSIFIGGLKIREEMTNIHSKNALVNDYYGRSYFAERVPSGLDWESFQTMPNLDILTHNVSIAKKWFSVKYGIELTNWDRISRFSASDQEWDPPESTLRAGTGSLDGQVLRVVTVVEEPFIMKAVDDEGKVSFYGYCIDILKMIQEKAEEKFGEKFTFEIYEVADGSYGVFDENKQKWSGLIGDILLRKADIAVAGMIRNFDREQVVDFTAPYMDYGVGILIRKPKAEINIFSFLEPLTIPIWALIALSAFFVSIVVFILSHLSPYEIGNDLFFLNYFNCVYWVMGALTQQGGEFNPTSMSNRVLGTAYWYFSLVVVAVYTANLAAFLTSGRLATPIESLSDLANQDAIPYGTVKESSLEAFFKDQAETTDVETYKSLWSQMKSDPSPMVRSVEEGYSRVLSSSYAFMWDYPVLQYQIQKNCDLMMVGKSFNRKNYAFAVPKSVHFLPTISLSILSLQEQGSLGSLGEKWFEGSSKCQAEGEEMTTAGLTVDNIGGIFYILGGGGFLSVLINIMENIWFKFMRKNPFPRREQDQSKRQLVSNKSSFLSMEKAHRVPPGQANTFDFEASVFSDNNAQHK